MQLSTELVDLIAQHRALEKKLASAMEFPYAPDAEIAQIKRMKLRIKDQITQIERSTQLAA